MLEVKIGISCDRLTFQLELDDGHCLLHLPHGEFVTYAFAVAGKACSWIVRPNGWYQFLKRRDRNSVAHL